MGTHSEGRRHAAITIFFFALATGSGQVFRYLPASSSTVVWKLFWILVCIVGVQVAHRVGPWEALGQLGLRGSVRLGMAVGLAASVPMLATLAFTSNSNPRLTTVPTLTTGVIAPLSEELLFRGYLFLQLYRRAGWSFTVAVVTTAGVFGLAHVGTLVGRTSAGQVLGELGMIAAGGAFYAWLLVRWRDNLWVPIGLHGFMNLSCELFACDERPGDWRTNAGRILTVVAAVILTVGWTRRRAAQSRAT